MARRRRRRRTAHRGQQKRKITISRDRVLRALSWVFRAALVCLLAFFLVFFFGKQVSVAGDSMKPVLQNGDVVLINRLSYRLGSPKRGDLIVFKPNGNENAHDYIKRVVGLPGETVSILEGEIYIDGEKLSETYETTPLTDTGLAAEPITLEKDEFFVLGDDRQNSEDSRDSDVGNVKRSDITGKAWLIFSPREDFGRIR